MANAGAIAAIAAARQAEAWRVAVVKANGVWAPYAASRGFYFGIGRVGWGHDRMPRLEGAFEGIRVALELVGSLYTAVLATPLAPLGGHVGITRANAASRFAEVFGAKDLKLGDDAFDRTYVVHATDASLAQRLVGPSTRAEMTAMDAYSFSYDDGAHDAHHPIVAMYIRAIPGTFEEIDRAFRVVADCARTQPEPSAPFR